MVDKIYRRGCNMRRQGFLYFSFSGSYAYLFTLIDQHHGHLPDPRALAMPSTVNIDISNQIGLWNITCSSPFRNSYFDEFMGAVERYNANF
ncbi:hypothetical protein BS78_K183000 [Paspalum vaginatum]|uniref:Uncharacterized protein n=1 Tax=Paspalum vaginatum TaxID=158149 RepID=A0A9W7XER1_9POAL|nr:hypothetical protein BS78_K183000 [Paspalum vaginatum]